MARLGAPHNFSYFRHISVVGYAAKSIHQKVPGEVGDEEIRVAHNRFAQADGSVDFRAVQ